MISTQEYAAGLRRQREKIRYHTDPAWRAKRLARQAKRHAERYATDAAYRARLQEAGRKKRN